MLPSLPRTRMEAVERSKVGELGSARGWSARWSRVGSSIGGRIGHPIVSSRPSRGQPGRVEGEGRGVRGRLGCTSGPIPGSDRNRTSPLASYGQHDRGATRDIRNLFDGGVGKRCVWEQIQTHVFGSGTARLTATCMHGCTRLTSPDVSQEHSLSLDPAPFSIPESSLRKVWSLLINVKRRGWIGG